MLSDIEIAQKAHGKPIQDVAAELGISPEDLVLYGTDKAKVRLSALAHAPKKEHPAHLVLVTAMNPTPAGEGKTTTTIGLADALAKLGKNPVLALREPSLGPVFGVKGGAAGGGYAQVIPMEEINLHFTGDFHAIGAANNLLAAMVDNHIKQGNELGIDPRQITWKRCVDMNDRQLRHVVDGLGGVVDGMPREDGFEITVASEIMAIMALSTSLADLKERLGRIVIGYTFDKAPVRARELHAEGAMCALLKDALSPNLVQTLEGTPAFVHLGPFANIAHGCNSLVADYMALSYGDIALTEAGFGADLGAEKFCDIACRAGNLKPSCAVVVATIRSLKYNGGVSKDALSSPNVEALKRGLPNLVRHAQNMVEVFGLPTVVALNRFSADTDEEIAAVREALEPLGIMMCESNVWEKGGEGGLDLAQAVLHLLSKKPHFSFSYATGTPLKAAISAVATRVYRARGVVYAPKAEAQIKRLEAEGFGELPVCIAKTQYSFSDDASKLAAPRDFDITVREVKVDAGAGFVRVLTGAIMTMPGLPKHPAAEKIDCDGEGVISGLF